MSEINKHTGLIEQLENIRTFPSTTAYISIAVRNALTVIIDDQESLARLHIENAALKAEVKRKDDLINSPENDDFIQGVKIEAAHQLERWGIEHDAGKTPWDWFWLIGYVSQKSASAMLGGDIEKGKHHMITTAAVMLNWHKRTSRAAQKGHDDE